MSRKSYQRYLKQKGISVKSVMLKCENQIRTVSDKLGNILEYHQVSILTAEKWDKVENGFKPVQ